MCILFVLLIIPSLVLNDRMVKCLKGNAVCFRYESKQHTKQERERETKREREKENGNSRILFGYVKQTYLEQNCYRVCSVVINFYNVLTVIIV